MQVHDPVRCHFVISVCWIYKLLSQNHLNYNSANSLVFFCATSCTLDWTETSSVALLLLQCSFQSLHKEWKWELGAKTKSFPVVCQECEGILSCFFYFFWFFLRRWVGGRQHRRAQKPTPTNTWPFSSCVCTCARFNGAERHSRFPEMPLLL